MANQYRRLMKNFYSLIKGARDKNQRRGYLAERKVGRALYYLKLRGEIRGYIWTAPDKKLDSQGKDFVISVIKDNKHYFMPLQVKSSEIGVLKHEEKEEILSKGKREARIPAVAVSFRNGDYDLAEKIKKILEIS